MQRSVAYISNFPAKNLNFVNDKKIEGNFSKIILPDRKRIYVRSLFLTNYCLKWFEIFLTPFVFNFCDLDSATAVAYCFPDSKRSKSVTAVTGIIYVPDKVHNTFILHIYD